MTARAGPLLGYGTGRPCLFVQLCSCSDMFDMWPSARRPWRSTYRNCEPLARGWKYAADDVVERVFHAPTDAWWRAWWRPAAEASAFLGQRHGVCRLLRRRPRTLPNAMDLQLRDVAGAACTP